MRVQHWASSQGVQVRSVRSSALRGVLLDVSLTAVSPSLQEDDRLGGNESASAVEEQDEQRRVGDRAGSPGGGREEGGLQEEPQVRVPNGRLDGDGHLVGPGEPGEAAHEVSGGRVEGAEPDHQGDGADAMSPGVDAPIVLCFAGGHGAEGFPVGYEARIGRRDERVRRP